MATRSRKTLADYMVIGISPALIIVLICSLIFFLMTVLYHGQYPARLSIIVFLFIMAAVLITRISIEEGTEYASLFALPLAVVTLLAMARFVRVPGISTTMAMLINVGMMVLIWWSAHKLTWNCTLIDEKEDASGEGLLQVMGLDQGDNLEVDADGTPQAAEVESPKSQPDRAGSSTRTIPVWQWFRDRMDRKRRKPGVPGVWVVYFSLAALPLFGIGQLFLSANATAERRIAFFMMCTYAGSALGLLLTTSFLGLRRYLRQRRLPMPMDMAASWLVIGALMIALVLVGAVLLPRPGAAVAISQLPFSFDSPDNNQPSRYGWGNEGAEPKQQDAQSKPATTQPRQPNSSNSSSGTGQDQQHTAQSAGKQAASNGSQSQGGEPRKMPAPSGQPQSKPQPGSQPAKTSFDQQTAPAGSDSANSQRSPGRKPGSQTSQQDTSRPNESQSRRSQTSGPPKRTSSDRSEPTGGKQGSHDQASNTSHSNSQPPKHDAGSSNSTRRDNQSGADKQSGSQHRTNSSPRNTPRSNSESGNRPPAQGQPKQGVPQRQPNSAQNQPDQKQSGSNNNTRPDRTQPPAKQTKSQDDRPKSARDPSRSSGGRQSQDATRKRRASQPNEASARRTSSQDQKTKPPPKSGDGGIKQERDKKSSEPADQQPAEQGRPDEAPSQSFNPGQFFQSLIGGMGKLIKILFLIALLALVGFLAWKYRETVKQAFLQLLHDLRQLWERLFGGARSSGAGQQDSERTAEQTVRSFSSYSNPFTTGTAESLAPEKLVRYSFEALQAWAAERHCPRAAEQTPLEFADQLARRFPELGSETLLLADLYSRLAYGHQRISSRRRAPLRRLWRQMVATARRSTLV